MDYITDNPNASMTDGMHLLVDALKMNGVETIYGYSIKVEPQYRHLENKANYRLGEVLRLGSIMTMLKNKYKSIRIFSVNDAIYFHSKYKFVPNIENIKEMKFALTTLIDDCSPLVLDLSKKAKELFVKVTKVDSENSKKQIGLEVNALIKEYITRVLKEGKNGKGHAFQKGFDMILTEEIVKNNATFFNKLFKKHGIDYKI